MLYANSIDLFNLGHAKFLTGFANEDQQREIVQRVRNLLNRPNPLDSGLSFPFDIEQCPKDEDENWTNFPIEDIENFRNSFNIPIPLMPEPLDMHSLLMWILGSYRLRQARKYTTAQSHREARDDAANLQDLDEMFQIARQKPKKLRIYVRHLEMAGDDWDEELFGPFPKDGLLLVYARLPSANLTTSSEYCSKKI